MTDSEPTPIAQGVSVVVKGVTGELRRGYAVAATLGRWHLRMGRCEAAIVSANTFHLESGGPFTLRLGVGKRIWQFQHVDVARSGETLHILAPGSPVILK